MTYRRYTYERGGWVGTLSPSGWASFRSGTVHHHVSMAAVCATQEQAQTYVKKKTDSLARNEPINKFIAI